MKYIKISLTILLSLTLFSCKKKTYNETTKINASTKSKVTTNKATTSNSTKQYEREGNIIKLGYYPKSLETNESIISSLEEKIDAFQGPASAESKGWIKQTDYASNSTREAYYYRDIDLDNDGANDYRAIHIYKYKNYNTSQAYDASSIWYHDTTTYSEGNTYYFKYEKISWNILEEKDGKAYLYSSIALDASYFEACSDEKSSKYTHGGKSGYANNYELSAIRKWLNNEFYNLAFNNLEKEIINTTIVNNGLSSTLDTTNDFICSNTNDKVFLLSEKELVTYYPTTSSRTYDSSILSDYAKIQDADYQKILLRSPDKNDAYDVKILSNQYTLGVISDAYVNYALYAIRPVIVIEL